MADWRENVEADEAAEKERPSGGHGDSAGVGESDGEGEESLVNDGEAKVWLSAGLKVGLKLVLI